MVARFSVLQADFLPFVNAGGRKSQYNKSRSTTKELEQKAGDWMLETQMDLLQATLEQWAGRKMPMELRKKIECIAVEEHWKKDSQMIALDEQPDKIYYICKGLCRSYYIDQKGNDVTRFFIEAGDWCLTEIQILDEPSELCVETLEDCEFLAFKIADLAVLQDSEFMKDAYIQALMNNIRYKIRRESMFLMCSATERYQDFLKRYPGLEQRITQNQLASYLGITPTSLSRIRRALRQDI